jgi:ring-1,2-phenylacetyl-CoA epoxidase subunit PaaC
VKQAVKNLLYRMADDELVLGHRHSEWTGIGPVLEEDIAFSSMAQDEMGHALVYYGMLNELGEPDPDTLAFTRRARQFRCASLVTLPNDPVNPPEIKWEYRTPGDWAFCIVRQFLYDVAESVRLSALCESTLAPLAQVARKLRNEEQYHLMHGRAWVLRLGRSTEDSLRRLQKALDAAYPHALGLFEPTEADETLAQVGILPRESELRRQWESAVAPVLGDAGLRVSDAVQPVYGGRVGRHPEALTKLLDDLQLVHNIDPSAKW